MPARRSVVPRRPCGGATVSNARRDRDATLAAIAKEVGVTVVGPLAGGEFGATLVTDADGRELVLKWMASTRWERSFARGAALANHLRASEYPAPRYIATGVTAGATWSLQERRPGAVPDVVSETHMRQLMSLAERHAGAAPDRGAWLEGLLPWIEDSLGRILDDARTRALALELGDVLARRNGVAVRDDGIVHGDFHHRNFLAEGEQVIAIFDWEFATTGDWRYDLVTMAFWSVLLPAQIPPAAAALAVNAMHHHCPRDVLALFAAMRATDQLDFNLRTYPQRLAEFAAAIEREIAPWWRRAR